MSDYLIVGLGNPGDQYLKTRHNIGWMQLDALAQRLYTSLSVKKEFHGELGQGKHGAHKLFLLKPLTYMNLSGKSVQAVMSYYKIPREHLLVICDEVHLDFGRARLRGKGSAGGQNGIKSIIQSLGSEEFARLRMGVGPFPAGRDMANFVLGQFPKTEMAALPSLLDAMNDGILRWVDQGLDAAVPHCNSYRLSP
jgi:PTH1 family peptidyl-tRNA hydrolase